jgi:hypothetical protein
MVFDLAFVLPGVDVTKIPRKVATGSPSKAPTGPEPVTPNKRQAKVEGACIPNAPQGGGKVTYCHL